MQVLVLAAGNSGRFKAQGFNTPKPFLPVAEGVSMLQSVVRTVFSVLNVQPVIVLQDKHERLYSGLGRVATTPGLMPSPIYSMLYAEKFLWRAEPIMVFDCDVLFSMDAIRDIIMSIEAARWGSRYFVGAVLRPTDEPDQHYFLNDKLVRASPGVEGWAAAGCYYASTWAFMRDQAHHTISSNPNVELHMADIINATAKDNTHFTRCEESIINVGTPELLLAHRENIHAHR